MFFAFLAAFASAFCIAVLGLMYKMAALRGCRSIPFTLGFLFTAGLLSLLKTGWEPTRWGDGRLWGISLAVGVLFYVGIPQIMAANRLGPASVNWTFVNLGLIVPVLVAPWRFHEPLLPSDALTMALFIVMLLFFARGMATGDETKPEHYLLYGVMLLAILANNGIVMTLLKEKDQLFPHDSSAGMGAIFYLSGGLFTLITAFVTERGQPFQWRAAGVGALAGLCSGVAIQLMLAAMALPAVVLYPLTQGVGLLGGVLLTAIIYRERLNPPKLTGLALGLAVLLCACLRGPLAEQIARLTGIGR
jgi:drug/metabolite transporter (DMT)-like permease